MSTRCTRHFLGWDQPALLNASQWILETYQTQARELDLSSVYLVVPGKRAARVLLGTLVDLCDQQRVVMVPPVILTPLEIPSAILSVPGMHASKLTCKLAWIQALQACPVSVIEDLIPESPDADRWDQWIGIGSWVAKLASELCDAGLRMNQVTPDRVPDLEESEIARWSSLGQVQQNYEHILSALGVVDDRLVAMDQAHRTDPVSGPDHHLILIGMPQLGSIARQSIELAGCDVDSLVYAPEHLADRFDEFGCVRTDQWSQTPINIQENRIQFQHDTASMCEHALTELASRANPIDTSSCVIGLADETLLGPLSRIAAHSGPSEGIHIHAPSGDPASGTPPGQLLDLIRSHLQERTFDTLSALIRHPDIERAMTMRSLESKPAQDEEVNRPAAWWLKAMDQIRQGHVQTGVVQIPTGVHPNDSKDMRLVIDCTDKMLKPLSDANTEQPLDQWTTAISDMLELIYKDTDLDPHAQHDQPVIEGLGAIRSVLDEIRDAQQLGQVMPQTQAHDALGVILDRLNQTPLPETVNRDAIETLGWLELALDPSPICIVIGMSEASIPESITHDPILPGSLRNALGMVTNEDRLARDAYLMSAINASRDAVFCCARMGDKNDPVAPSRLLLRTTGSTLAKRVQRFVTPSLDTPSPHRLSITASPGLVDRFRKPLVIAPDYTAPESMAVTEFDSYLRSPAGWYMERKLKLKEIDTTARELSPMILGNVVHAVLEGFGSDPSLRDLDDPDTINDALRALLDQVSVAQFGSRPPAAVQIQTKLLSHRMEWFAQQQAVRRQQGWRIAHTEWSPAPESAPLLTVDDQPMPLRGKVDRIDIHDDGRVEVLDYKTGKISTARAAHQSQDRWKKLQLPLYRHLVKPLVGDHPITLGYAGVPAHADEPVWSIADWEDSELEDADNAAREVVRQIRNFTPGQAVPMGDSPPNEGVMGFISGERFDTGGHNWSDDSELEDAEVVS